MRDMISKCKLIGLLLLLTAASADLFSQTGGIAVEDSGIALAFNPAAIAAGRASGIAFRQYFNEKEDFTDTWNLYLNTENLSYNLDSLSGDYFHRFSLALEGGEGIYYGASLRWPDGSFDSADFGLSSLVRPYPWLSLGIRADDITGPYADMVTGAGIRPFASSGSWLKLLTVYADSEISDVFSPVCSGIIIEPAEGLRIRGEYRHEEKALSAGITFATRFLSTSADSDVSDGSVLKEGSYSLFASAKRMRSFVPLPGKMMIEYDRAGVIGDFPVSGFSVTKLVGGSGRSGISLMEFFNEMEMIKRDPDIHAILFRDQDFSTSFANMQEISRSLSEVKKAGKKIYFYFESVSAAQYALAASVADGIFISPQGSVNIKGFSRTRIYMKDFFSRVGIRFYNFRSHDYKTAYNNLTESAMTDGERQALDYFYSSLEGGLAAMIEKGRGERLKRRAAELVGMGPYLSSAEALKEGLVDGRFYPDELDKWKKDNRYFSSRYSAFPGYDAGDWEYSVKPQVVVIHVTGSIVTGEGLKGENAGSSSVAGAIRAARENPLVSGIILRINSGGGSALASDIIAREVSLCREGEHSKPVVVSMGGAAASGGYYIAAPANHIFANSATITGSIGVIALMSDISGLLEKLDLKSETVKKTESGDFGNFTRPLSGDEENKIRSYISETYGQFVDVVSRGRGIAPEKVDESGRGRIWTGSQAVERSLADSEGGLADAVNYLEKNYLSGKKSRVTEIVPGRPVFSISSFMGLASAGDEDITPEAIRTLFDFLRKTDYYGQGEMLYLMPYTAEELGLEER